MTSLISHKSNSISVVYNYTLKHAEDKFCASSATFCD